MLTDQDVLLDPKETAETLGVSVKTLARRRISPPDGPGLPFVRLGGPPKGPVRYRRSDVLALMSRVATSTRAERIAREPVPA